MTRGFSSELDKAESRDTELTVGPVMMSCILGGLVGLCCICFAIGYAVGHRSAAEPVNASIARPTGSQASIQASGSAAKPAAAAQMPPQPAPAPVADPAADTSSQDAAVQDEQRGASANPSSSPATQPQMTPASESQVRTALSTQSSASQTGQSAPEAKVQPALSRIPGWMVQVAAVSHPEDAEVLVSALRKRGYPVSVRHEVSDNLVHVRVGPFAVRNDANAMQQKLLSDGYNALVQP